MDQVSRPKATLLALARGQDFVGHVIDHVRAFGRLQALDVVLIAFMIMRPSLLFCAFEKTPSPEASLLAATFREICLRATQNPPPVAIPTP